MLSVFVMVFSVIVVVVYKKYVLVMLLVDVVVDALTFSSSAKKYFMLCECDVYVLLFVVVKKCDVVKELVDVVE